MSFQLKMKENTFYKSMTSHKILYFMNILLKNQCINQIKPIFLHITKRRKPCHSYAVLRGFTKPATNRLNNEIYTVKESGIQ